MTNQRFEDLRKSKRILIAASDARLVRISERLYLNRGYEAFGACSSSEALEIAREKCPQVVLVSAEGFATDVAAFIDTLKSNDPDCNVILFARDEEAELIKNAWRAGAFFFLRQGATRADILPEVERAFEDYFARVQIRYLRQSVFVIMPFSPLFGDVYELGIKAAAVDCGLVCERVDEQHFTESILEVIFANIKRARFIVADVTMHNPNVFFEVGYAFAQKKPIIFVTRDNTDAIPFDLRLSPHIVYEGRITLLRQRLQERLRGLLDQGVGLEE
jgi:ActR/RegA family two-component response regulator